MIINILAIIFVFGTVIIIHEWGHFLVAKKAGIKVEKFSFGLGPPIFKFKKGETIYQISPFPLGGFVKLAGEYPEEAKKDSSPQEKKREYFSKPLGIRALVIAAGPFNNILLGFLIFVFVFLLGVETPDFSLAKIGTFTKNAPAEKSGLQQGDVILMIDNNKINRWEDMAEIIHRSAGKKLKFLVKRESEEFSLNITPEEKLLPAPSGKMEKIGLIGIMPATYTERVGLPLAIKKAAINTRDVTVLIFVALKKIFTKEIPARYLAGPVGIAQLTARFAHTGLSNFLSFIALISINLGIINLFPFFILDGGRIAGLGIEKITRKTPSKRLLEISQTVGIALLLALFLFITYNDLLRLFKK